MQRKHIHRNSHRSTLALLATVASVSALAPVISRADPQSNEPNLTCPAGSVLLGQYSGTLVVEGTAALPHEIDFSTNLPVAMSSVDMTVWTAVGHPENGCAIGPGNDGGAPLCDQASQLNEELWVDAFGFSTFIPDHGTDNWDAFGDIAYGAQAAGTHPITFRHSNISTNDTPESVTFKAILCGVPGEIVWDKSSLQFKGPAVVADGVVTAEICNNGDEDMLLPSTWELYFASRGNPKDGAVIDSGIFGPLDSKECTLLSAPDQGLTGNFKFKAYQAAGHPGQGELWSN